MIPIFESKNNFTIRNENLGSMPFAISDFAVQNVIISMWKIPKHDSDFRIEHWLFGVVAIDKQWKDKKIWAASPFAKGDLWLYILIFESKIEIRNKNRVLDLNFDSDCCKQRNNNNSNTNIFCFSLS